MLEVRRMETGVARCYARPAALDALPVPPGAFAGRVAPDELLLLGPDVTGHAAAGLAESDPHAIVVDGADAYAIFALAGEGVEEAFARLSELPLPAERPAFLQGLVAHVPAKIVALPDELRVLVPSTLGHHLRDRVLAACADLSPVEVP